MRELFEMGLFVVGLCAALAAGYDLGKKTSYRAFRAALNALEPATLAEVSRQLAGAKKVKS